MVTVPAAAISVHFAQVGQGDATLVVDHDSGEAMLVDCPAGREDVVEDLLRDANVTRLKAVVLTHWDRDHYGGLLEILRSVKTDAFYYNHETIIAWSDATNLRRAALRELLEEDLASVSKRHAQRGAEGSLGGSLRWRLLAPFHDDLTRGAALGDRNACSGVVEFAVGSARFLIGGDADGRAWERLVAEGDSLKCDVLRWPHHGGLNVRGGMNEVELMDKARPDWVVVSAGSRNRYGHPNLSTVSAARSARLGCTEVTPLCHSSATGGPLPCGGTMTIEIDSSATPRESAGWAGLDTRVDGWSHPMCRADPVSQS